MTAGGNSTKKRRIRCTTNGEIYPSIRAAAASQGSAHTNLYVAIKLNKRWKGMFWEYVDDDNETLEEA
eukprot:g31361.t1